MELERILTFNGSHFLILQWEIIPKGRCLLCPGSQNFLIVKVISRILKVSSPSSLGFPSLGTAAKKKIAEIKITNKVILSRENNLDYLSGPSIIT